MRCRCCLSCHNWLRCLWSLCFGLLRGRFSSLESKLICDLKMSQNLLWRVFFVLDWISHYINKRIIEEKLRKTDIVTQKRKKRNIRNSVFISKHWSQKILHFKYLMLIVFFVSLQRFSQNVFIFFVVIFASSYFTSFYFCNHFP